MSQEKKSNRKLPRREFLANLLFGGAALSVSGLQANYDLVARREPEKDSKDDGWDLPDLNDEKKPQKDGWELPEDLLDSPDPPPTRPPRPIPQPKGAMRPPTIRGKVAPPYPGDVEPLKPPSK